MAQPHNHCVMPTTAVAFLPLYTSMLIFIRGNNKGSARLPVCCSLLFHRNYAVRRKKDYGQAQNFFKKSRSSTYRWHREKNEKITMRRRYLLSISCTPSLISSSSFFNYNPTRIANPDSLNSGLDQDQGFFAESGSRSEFRSSVELINFKVYFFIMK